MILIVGLGNPGEKYEKTRHNIGFQIINTFAGKNNFPSFNFTQKFNAFTVEEIFAAKKIILAKPQTFMNNSGKTVQKIISFNKLPIPNLWVINDDIDLPIGKIKISEESGSAGHKGVESIISALGSKNFIRFRIGVQPIKGKPKRVESFVIKNFSKDEKKIIPEIINKAVSAIETSLTDGIEKAMNLYN